MSPRCDVNTARNKSVGLRCGLNTVVTWPCPYHRFPVAQLMANHCTEHRFVFWIKQVLLFCVESNDFRACSVLKAAQDRP